MKITLVDGKPVLHFEFIRFERGTAVTLSGQPGKSPVPCVHYQTPNTTGTIFEDVAVEALENRTLSEDLLKLAYEVESEWEGRRRQLNSWGKDKA